MKITHEKICQPTERIGISELHSLCGVDITGLAASLPRLQVGLPCHGRSSEQMGGKRKNSRLNGLTFHDWLGCVPPTVLAFFWWWTYFKNSVGWRRGEERGKEGKKNERGRRRTKRRKGGEEGGCFSTHVLPRVSKGTVCCHGMVRATMLPGDEVNTWRRAVGWPYVVRSFKIQKLILRWPLVFWDAIAKNKRLDLKKESSTMFD